MTIVRTRASDQPAVIRRAILMLVLAMACATVMDTIAKVLSHGMDPLQVAWGRFAFIFLAFVPFFLARGARAVLTTAQPRLQAARALLQIVSSLAFFTAVAWAPLADVVAVAFSAPLFIVLFSIPILGERPGWRRLLTVLAGLAGMLVIVRPGLGTASAAMGLAVLAAIAFALFQIIARLLARTDHGLTTLFYSNVLGLALLSFAVPAVWTAPAPADWALMAALGGFGAIAHFLMLEAFSAAPASSLAPFTYTEIVWAAAVGYLVFGDVPGPWVVLGAAIVVASGVCALRLEGRGTA